MRSGDMNDNDNIPFYILKFFIDCLIWIELLGTLDLARDLGLSISLFTCNRLPTLTRTEKARRTWHRRQLYRALDLVSLALSKVRSTPHSIDNFQHHIIKMNVVFVWSRMDQENLTNLHQSLSCFQAIFMQFSSILIAKQS